jgi:hypothetical protein
MNQPEYEITGGPSSEENVTLTAADEDSIRTENCVVDQSEMKKKYFAPKIAAGDYDRLAGTPLTIKRTGGGCT